MRNRAGTKSSFQSKKKNITKRLVYLLLGLFLHLSASVTTAAAPATETAGQVLARLYKRWHLKLVEKEPFLVDVDFIGPILDQSGKEFSQIFLGR